MAFIPFWNKYPYTDFHELNLDWIISELKRIEESLVGIDSRIGKKKTHDKRKQQSQQIIHAEIDDAEDDCYVENIDDQFFLFFHTVHNSILI